jgi:hypothetical protein
LFFFSPKKSVPEIQCSPFHFPAIYSQQTLLFRGFQAAARKEEEEKKRRKKKGKKNKKNKKTDETHLTAYSKNF